MEKKIESFLYNNCATMKKGYKIEIAEVKDIASTTPLMCVVWSEALQNRGIGNWTIEKAEVTVGGIKN